MAGLELGHPRRESKPIRLLWPSLPSPGCLLFPHDWMIRPDRLAGDGNEDLCRGGGGGVNVDVRVLVVSSHLWSSADSTDTSHVVRSTYQPHPGIWPVPGPGEEWQEGQGCSGARRGGGRRTSLWGSSDGSPSRTALHCWLLVCTSHGFCGSETNFWPIMGPPTVLPSTSWNPWLVHRASKRRGLSSMLDIYWPGPSESVCRSSGDDLNACHQLAVGWHGPPSPGCPGSHPMTPYRWSVPGALALSARPSFLVRYSLRGTYPDGCRWPHPGTDGRA